MLSETFQRQKLAFDLTLLNADVYLDDSVPGLLPTGTSRLSDQQVRDTFGDGLKLQSKKNGYFAAIYYDSKREAYIYVNRGSGTNPFDEGDWRSNFLQNKGLEAPQFEQAIANAKYLAENYKDTTLIYSGHSLGGGLAAAQAQITGRTAYVFNSSGLHINTLARHGNSFKGIENNVISYNVAGDGLTFLQDKLLPGIKADIAIEGVKGPVRRILAEQLLGNLPPDTPVRGQRFVVPSVSLGGLSGKNKLKGFAPTYEEFKHSFAKSSTQRLARKVSAPPFTRPGGGGNPYVTNLLDLHGIHYVSNGLVKQMGIF